MPTLKENIINNFLKDERRNFTIYQTNSSELAGMFDRLINSIKSGEKFERFLMFENAVSADGRIRFDRQVSYFDKELKKDIKTKLVFKYPVYSYFYSEYKAVMGKIEEKRKNEPLPEPPPGLPDNHWTNN